MVSCAMRLPKQPRGPAPKGWYAIGSLIVEPAAKRSVLNSYGSV